MAKATEPEELDDITADLPDLVSDARTIVADLSLSESVETLADLTANLDIAIDSIRALLSGVRSLRKRLENVK